MLAFWAALRGSAAPAIEPALAAFALGPVADRPCRWLSAGQRRRLALARLVAAPAPIWLLDEPNAALDGGGDARLAALIDEHPAAAGRGAGAAPPPAGRGRVLGGEHGDGSVDLIALSAAALELVVLAKGAAHWVTTGLPLTLVSPVLAIFVDLDPGAIPVLMLGLLLGTPALSLLGAI